MLLSIPCREKSEKRCLNPSTASPVSSSGVARVPPTSHVGPIQSIRGNHAAGKGSRGPAVLGSAAQGSAHSPAASSPSFLFQSLNREQARSLIVVIVGSNKKCFFPVALVGMGSCSGWVVPPVMCCEC